MTCRELIDFLAEYLNGELPQPQRQEFDRHLTRCASCVAYVQNYQMTIRLGKAAFAEREPMPEDIPEELVQAILAARTKQRRA